MSSNDARLLMTPCPSTAKGENLTGASTENLWPGTVGFVGRLFLDHRQERVIGGAEGALHHKAKILIRKDNKVRG
jgi:hypothetical protein